MLVLEDGFGGMSAVTPSWRDRLAARTSAERLDRALAAGASPDSSARLALRARHLTSTANRRGLERSVRRIIGRCQQPDVPGVPVPSAHRAIVATAETWGRLADRLGRSGPVSVCGVAQASVLLSDAWGPATRGCSPAELGSELREAIEALSLEAER